jgi:hypothetical protein
VFDMVLRAYTLEAFDQDTQVAALVRSSYLSRAVDGGFSQAKTPFVTAES